MVPEYQDFSHLLSIRSKSAAVSLDAILPVNQITGSILDLGFGDGTLIQELSRLRPHWDVCGFDLNPVSLDELKRSLPSADLRIGDGLSEMKRNHKKYDLIIASHFFYYFKLGDWKNIHDLLLSRLTPSGKIAVCMASNCSNIYSPESITSLQKNYLRQGTTEIQLLFSEDFIKMFPAYLKKWRIRYDLRMKETELAAFYQFANRIVELSDFDDRFIAQLSGKNYVTMFDVWAIYER